MAQQRVVEPGRRRPGEGGRGRRGGIGRNGAQKTPEAQDGNLIPAGGTYRFVAGRLHNLNARNSAGDLIRNHGDVGNRDVAYAVLSAIAAVPA